MIYKSRPSGDHCPWIRLPEERKTIAQRRARARFGSGSHAGSTVEPRNRVNSRIRRIEEFGNYGDCEPVGDGIYELKFDTGPGYRVYFGIDEDEIILLGAELRTPKFRISERRSSVGGTTMPKRVTGFREDLLADLSDPNEAACYLNAAFEDSEQMVLVALRDVAEARQMARVAEEAGVTREALYRMLHKAGNPTYASLVGILNALGLKMVFAPAAPAIDPTAEIKEASEI